MEKIRYEATEQKVQRHSSFISYKESDCRIVNNFGGWESMYFETIKGAELFARTSWDVFTKRDQYNCVFAIDEQKYSEENDCWEPTGKCIIHDYWTEQLQENKGNKNE